MHDDMEQNCAHHTHEHTHESTHAHLHTHTGEHAHQHDGLDPATVHSHEHTHVVVHDHEHAHMEEHAHTHFAEAEINREELTALLSYTLQQSQHYNEELLEMQPQLRQLGLAEAAEQLGQGIADFAAGNGRLEAVIDLLKE